MQYGPCHELESVSNVISIQLTGCLVYLINVPGCICTCELDLNRKLKVNRWLSSVYEKHCISKEKKKRNIQICPEKYISYKHFWYTRNWSFPNFILSMYQKLSTSISQKNNWWRICVWFSNVLLIQIYCVMILFHNTFIHRVMNRSKINE